MVHGLDGLVDGNPVDMLGGNTNTISMTITIERQ